MDVIIRDLPTDVVIALDESAKKLGVSRNEYVRRELSAIAKRRQSDITAADWERFAELAADLGDPDVMAGAWDGHA